MASSWLETLFLSIWPRRQKNCCISAASCGSHSLSSLLNIPPTHTCTPFYNLPSCVCLWTLIINSHNIFSCIPIDPRIETSLICSLLLDIFSSPVSFFSKLWQAVQILAVCCSPLILCQTFLLHKYTRISEEMQSDIRWPQKHSSLWYTVFKNEKKKSQLLHSRFQSWYINDDEGQVVLILKNNLKAKSIVFFIVTHWSILSLKKQVRKWEIKILWNIPLLWKCDIQYFHSHCKV